MTPDGLAEQASALREAVRGLNEAIDSLATRVIVSERTTKRITMIVTILILSLALMVSIIGYLIVSKRNNDRYVACQANINEVMNIRTKILTEVGAREREAERARNRALDATFLDPSLLKPVEQRTEADIKRVRDLFLAYRKAAEQLIVEQKAADEARLANPVPPPPSSICH